MDPNHLEWISALSVTSEGPGRPLRSPRVSPSQADWSLIEIFWQSFRRSRGWTGRRRRCRGRQTWWSATEAVVEPGPRFRDPTEYQKQQEVQCTALENPLEWHVSSSAPATEKEKRSRGGGREPAGITHSGKLALHTPVEASEASSHRDLAAPLRTGLISRGTLYCGPLGACAARSPRHLATPVPADLICRGTLNDSPIEAGGARVAGFAAGPPAGRCPFWGRCGGGSCSGHHTHYSHAASIDIPPSRFPILLPFTPVQSRSIPIVVVVPPARFPTVERTIFPTRDFCRL